MGMQGQYKVGGGKLVIVDLEVEDARIAHPHLSGDFFLEPDEALNRIDQALTGLSIESSVSQIAEAIAARLEPTDALIGFSPRDVGFAVRRALGASTAWSDHTFELIEDIPRSPQMQMALDQVYAEALASGRRGPTLRFWQWGGPAVVIGSFQSLSNEVDLAAAERFGLTVVRRISGGGAMFVEPGNTITYSLVVPGSLVDGMSFERSYEFLDAWVLAGLGELGVEASYQPINDITSPAGKIAGAAQKRLGNDTVLHHVTMAYDIDAAKMMAVLRIGREKLSDKGIKSADKRVDPLRSQTAMSRADIVEALIGSFARQHALRPSQVSAEEVARAEQLVESKFATREWIARVP